MGRAACGVNRSPSDKEPVASMSSMVRYALIAALFASTAGSSVAVLAQEPGRASLVASQPSSQVAFAVNRWEQLAASPRFTFDEYASFLLSNPGFPDEDRLRAYAEERLTQEFVAPDRLLAYFDRFPPLTNNGRAQHALALMAQRPGAATEAARAAWRGGGMSDTAEGAIRASYGGQFAPEDHDARMDALLWQRDAAAAARQLPYVSQARMPVFMARLAILQGGDGATSDASATADPGYLFNRSRELRLEGRPFDAVSLLATRPALSSAPFDKTAWVEEHLNVARIATAGTARQVAERASEAFASEAEVAEGAYKLRDDYTSLMWLGGTRALWDLGDGNGAAPLFYRYGASAKTPQTRSKGFFWAGHAAQQAGNTAEANRYYEMAAAYPEYFYGLLAIERLGRAAPSFALSPATAVAPTPEQVAAFQAKPLVQAMQVLSTSGNTWQTKRKFYVQAASQMENEAEMALLGQLAQQLQLPELAVVIGRVAPEKSFSLFTPVGFPTLPTPPDADWTMVHAIARQESEFDDYRMSHAGAQGLMQLMPGTAREQAGRLGMAYMSASLMGDTQYNLRLGNSYIQRMYNSYGSYPLAVAAYNAGPGNVNKWLRENGDPRTGAISWIDWIEKIGFFETKNYVARVIENAVVYEAMHPDKATQGRPRTVSEFLR
jgi:soluble lytic murein transglycosylase